MEMQEMIGLRDEIIFYLDRIGYKEMILVKKIARNLHMDSPAEQSIHSMIPFNSIHGYREGIARLARQINDKSLLVTVYNLANRYLLKEM